MSNVKTAVYASSKKLIAIILVALMALSVTVISTKAVSNEQYCYNFLTSNCGFNRAAACGVLANIKEESNFNPKASGDSSKSYGICQWNSSRKTSLIKFCQRNGLDYTSLYGQLSYLKNELVYDYPEVGKYLVNTANNSQGAYNAGYYFCYNYERPANKSSKSQARGRSAQTFFSKYAGVTSSSVSASVGSTAAKPVEGTNKTFEVGTYKVAANGTNLNMRSGAGTGYKIVAKVPDATVINVTAVNGSWGKTTYNGTEGWVSLTWCEKQANQNFDLLKFINSFVPKAQ